MVDEGAGRCADGEFPFYETHIDGIVNQPRVGHHLLQRSSEYLRSDMLIAFPLVDDEAVMKVSAVVEEMLQPVDDGTRVSLRRNPAGGFAVQAVQVVFP